MRVRRTTEVILPGIESVEVEGHGVFNFRDGEADVSDANAKILIDAGEAKAIGASPIVVTSQMPKDPPPGGDA